MALLLLAAGAQAASITWAPATDVSGIGDVATTGTLVEAINASASGASSPTVNGVTFTAASVLNNNNGVDVYTGTTGDVGYDTLLSNVDFGSDSSFEVGGSELIAGMQYLVQVWFADTRNASASARNMTIGDGEAVQNTVVLNAGSVQYAIGTFIADGTSQTLTVAGDDGSGGAVNAHINGYQLRLLNSRPAGSIAWGEPTDVSATNDVSTAGTLVEAFNAGSTSAEDVTVNGVLFTGSGSLLPLNATVDAYDGDTGDAEYNMLLSNIDYGGGSDLFSKFVGGGILEAGAEYLIQVWYVDTRFPEPNTMRFGDGGSNAVELVSGPAGQYVTGLFTAADTTQELTFDALGSLGNAHITAYQIRKLTPGTDSGGLPYNGTWAALQQMPVPAWFDEGKIGIFIHWGPYSAIGYRKGGSGYAEHVPKLIYTDPDHYYPYMDGRWGAYPPEFGYKDIVPEFTAENWDPDAWAALFKSVGAHYVVMTAEHHDGWANWDSDLTPWNAVDRGPQRDLVGDLGAAVKKQGLKFAPSYHRERHQSFFCKTLYVVDAVPQDDIVTEISNVPEAASLYGPFGTTEAFVDDYVARWKEIQAKYKPDFLWIDDIPIWTRDGNDVLSGTAVPEVQYFYDQCRQMITDFMNDGAERGAPVYCNNKGTNLNWPMGVGCREKDNLFLSSIGPKWQSCTTFGTSYGYLENDTYKTVESVIHEMVGVISRNGNFLINIGPMADGTIPPPQLERLQAMGGWLGINGDAIYGSHYWTVSDQADEELVFTANSNNLYAIRLSQPTNAFTITETAGWASDRIQGVRLLGSSAAVPWEMTTNGLRIAPPADLGPTEYAWAFEIQTDEMQHVAPSDQPMVALSTASSPVAGAFAVDIAFSEAVTGLELSDFAVSNATLTALSGTHANYSVELVPESDGDVTIRLPANTVTDIDGDHLWNLGSGELVTFYSKPLTVAIHGPTSTDAAVFKVYLTFSEAVSGLESNDLSVANGQLLSLAEQGRREFAKRYYIAEIAASTPGAVTVSVPADVVVDEAAAQKGNLASGLFTVDCSTDFNRQWIVDSGADWSAAMLSNRNLVVSNEMVEPTAGSALFASIVKTFPSKRKARSVTFIQSPAWNHWIESPTQIGASAASDAPVFVAVGDKDYYHLGKASDDGYHAWHSTNMVDWVHYGQVTTLAHRWVTTAEYKDGQFYIYVDYPNDHTPHLYIDDDLKDGTPGTFMGKAFDDPTHGSDCAILRDNADGLFHMVCEDWTPLNASTHAWDSPLATHASSADGFTGFVPAEHVPPIDFRTTPTGEIGTYASHSSHRETGEWPDTFEYEIHEPDQEAFGDWTAVKVGARYYFFADYHFPGAAKADMEVACFATDSLYEQLDFVGTIDSGGHPDPAIGFAEGRFYLITQENDFTSPGPWVDGVEARAGVDTDGDGTNDQWTAWQSVGESYDYTPGYVRVVTATPAQVDLSGLPEGYGFSFEFRIDDTVVSGAAPIMDSVVMDFEPSNFRQWASSGGIAAAAGADNNTNGIPDIIEFSIGQTVIPERQADGTMMVTAVNEAIEDGLEVQLWFTDSLLEAWSAAETDTAGVKLVSDTDDGSGNHELVFEIFDRNGTNIFWKLVVVAPE